MDFITVPLFYIFFLFVVLVVTSFFFLYILVSCFVCFVSFLAIYTPMLFFPFNFEYTAAESFSSFFRPCRSKGVLMITNLQRISVESLLLFAGWCGYFILIYFLLFVFCFEEMGVVKRIHFGLDSNGVWLLCECEIVNCLVIQLEHKNGVCHV